MHLKEIQRKIELGIPDSRVEVVGEEAHYGATIVSPAFEGKTRIEQHQMVYALLREEMANQSVHALSLRTLTPVEWEKEKGAQEI
ncbi:MAG: BolA/IbaG family iron-sulfur metabolism protein [Acidobacteria bacterium]|nr:BolA/IbaG family iron-sulfur metabolism protein [Acidobacteriota bacterium]